MTNTDIPIENESAVSAFFLSEKQISPQFAEPISLTDDLSDEFIQTLNPSIPVPVLMPEKVRSKAREFVANFTGHVMYAVKCNPDPVMLKAIYSGGVRRFDVASIAEVRLISELFPDAVCYFMHPIKSPEAIREAYVNHGVRAFVLDYADELDKILQATNAAPDLELFVRMAVPKDNPGGGVATDFAKKFGARPEVAAELLKLCRPHCARLGLSFHVGTQCPQTDVYSKAISWASYAIENSGVYVEALDVGGGFPAQLDPENPVPVVSAYTQTIAKAVADHKLGELELLCEVGRGLVADGGALIVRVEGRKGNLLYLNDGTYGGMLEASGAVGLSYPVHLIRRDNHRKAGDIAAFRFTGPTCDSIDMMEGPFMLPDDIAVGDWIKVEQLGAYGEVSRTDFNGFGSVQKIIVQKSAKAKAKSKNKAKFMPRFAEV